MTPAQHERARTVLKEVITTLHSFAYNKVETWTERKRLLDLEREVTDIKNLIDKEASNKR